MSFLKVRLNWNKRGFGRIDRPRVAGFQEAQRRVSIERAKKTAAPVADRDQFRKVT
jgi:hypothetical protein